MGSGVIYAGIVIAWAAVLIPMWLRRHDEAHEARSGGRVPRAVRVLTRREERHVAKPSRGPAADPSPDQARHGGQSTRRARARVAARRRRTLLALLLCTLVVTVCAVLGLLPAWSPAVPAFAVVGYLVHLRSQARHEAELGRRRREARERSAARLRRVDSAERVVAVRREREAERMAAIATAEAAAAAELAARAAAEEAERRAAEQAEREAAEADERRAAEQAAAGWDPRSAPLPTYVTKPKASRPPRTIDLRASGAWTAASAHPAGSDQPDRAGTDLAAADRAADGAADGRPAGPAAGGATAIDATTAHPAGRDGADAPAAIDAAGAVAGYDEDPHAEVLEQRRVVGG